MKKRPVIQIKHGSTPTQLAVFTGGKAPEFAIFFNTAFTKLLRSIHFWKTGKIEFDENNLDGAYGDLIDQFESGNVPNDLDEQIYVQLRNYIWKGYRTERNSAGYILETTDRKMIRLLIAKLRALRNFHSHVYHDNAELTFHPQLQQFIKELHDDAMFAFSQKHPEEIGFYQRNLEKHPLFKDNRITQEGRTFFLSLFLTTGEVSRLLQQRRGSKKNDELRFRIKHYIYRYYAHRDGAARKYYNLEEGMHSTLPEEELQSLLFAQKFYKINTQINDVPAFLHEQHFFPLYYRGKDGSFTCCESVQDLLTFCQQNGLANSFHFKPVVFEVEEIKTQQITRVEKNNAIRFSLNNEPAIPFETGLSDFHRIILDIIRLGEPEIIRRMQFFLKERIQLINALKKPDPENYLGQSGETPVTLIDYEKYKLRGGRRLKEKFVEWLMAYENNHKHQAKLRGLLTTSLHEAPIELRHFDLYQEADQKIRTTHRFMEWCVEYLIDFRIVPEWHWAFESFQTVLRKDAKTGQIRESLRKVIRYFPQKPGEGNWRLCVEDDHILVKHEQTSSQRPFALGIGTLQNLMVLLYDRPKKSESKSSFIHMLLTRISTELTALEAAISTGKPFDLDTLSLLDRNSIPETLLQAAGETSAIENRKNWREATKKRLQYLITTLENVAKNKSGLSRAAKNEQVMRCYQFFDWDPKFLRRNEYQQLSIYHYSLERITYWEDHFNRAKISGQRKDELMALRQLRFYDDILKEIKEENPRRIPPEADEVLRQATSLDDLLDRIIAKTLVNLRKWYAEMGKGTPARQVLIAQRLKIKQEGPSPIVMPPGLPFHIHPYLVLKAFFNQSGTDLTRLSLSKIIRDNMALITPLRTENYDSAAYEQLAEAWPNAKNIRKKITGVRHQCQTRDALLWHIAGQYFQQVSPSVKMSLGDKKTNAMPVRVGSLRKSTLQIPVRTKNQGDVSVELFFHQLDDTLFVESKDMLVKIVDYIYCRRREAPDIYAEVGENQLNYGEIVKEMARLQNDAMVIAARLLDWEMSVLNELSEAEIQRWVKGQTLKCVGFDSICQIANCPEGYREKLTQLRNHVFHMKVPTDFTYRSVVAEPEILKYLGEISFNKDHSRWEQPSTQQE